MQAWAAVWEDLRKDLGRRAALGPTQAEQNLVFAHPGAAPRAGDVVGWERADAEYSGRAARVAPQWHCIIRLPRQSFTAVHAFGAAPAQEGVVTRAVTAKARR